MTSEVWTVRRLLEWTTDFLKNHGADSPRLEAELLLAHALGVSRIELYLQFENVPAEDKRGKFRDFVKRRGAGEPVAYLIGHKEFYSIDFEVNSDVLIPRPETEQIVLEGIEYLRRLLKANPETRPAVLDLGTGSGAIAVAIAKNVPQSAVTAVDLSPQALAVAQKNAQKADVADRIEFFVSDLFEKVPSDAAFDLIVSNPPYVSESEYRELSVSVKNYEPKLALTADEEGTAILRRILDAASKYLKSGGKILLEFSPMIAEKVREMAVQKDDFTDIAVLKDFSGLKRVLTAVRK